MMQRVGSNKVVVSVRSISTYGSVPGVVYRRA